MPDINDLPTKAEKIDLREKVLDEIEKIDAPRSPEAGRERISQPERPETPRPEMPSVAEESAAGREMPGSIGAGRSDQARQKEIEDVLARDLADLYREMPESRRREFKQAGEETAGKINELFTRGKATAKKIVDLIKRWLGLIPGVNRFFLEQEAKIKTDEILRLNGR